MNLNSSVKNLIIRVPNRQACLLHISYLTNWGGVPDVVKGVNTVVKYGLLDELGVNGPPDDDEVGMKG